MSHRKLSPTVSEFNLADAARYALSRDENKLMSIAPLDLYEDPEAVKMAADQEREIEREQIRAILGSEAIQNS
jgi:hypothetical protein